MKKFFNLLIVTVLAVLFIGSSLEAAQYKYIYKNGKKYKVRVGPKKKSSTAKYKYIYKNGKKYKVRVKPKVLNQKRPRSVKSESRQEAAKKNKDNTLIELFGYKIDKFDFWEADLVSKSVSEKYTINTNSKTDENNDTLAMTLDATGESYYLDGSKYNFSNSKSVIGLEFKSGYETDDYDQIYVSLFYSQEFIDVSFAYLYAMPSLEFYDITPYIEGRYAFSYKDLSSLSGIIMDNGHGLGYGFGGKYMTKSFTINGGLTMVSKRNETDNWYGKETQTTNETNINVGIKYEF